MAEMIIREQQESDKEELKRLMLAVRYPPKKAETRAKEFANGKTKIILVGVNNKRLVGFVGFKLEDDNTRAVKFIDTKAYAHLNWTAVHPDFRHRGFGSALVQACHDFVAENWRDKKGVWLDCREGVLNFYQYNGYNIVGEYKEDNSDRYILLQN